jgi:hypothetical protein
VKRTTLWFAVLASVCAAQAPAAAQSKSSPKFYEPPRLTDGKPDFNGIWEVRARVDADLEGKIGNKRIIVDPPDGKIPYKPEALARKKDNAQKRPAADPMSKCFMPGVPRLMYVAYPFQIVESANQSIISFLSQYNHTVRNIFLNGEHLDGLDFWLGDSRAHWEGDTLVVDVADFNDQTWFDAAGNYHSEALHVVERFTRTSPDTITYEAMIEDPKVLTRPFKISVPLTLHTEKNAQILESECFAAKEGPTVTAGDKPDTGHGK